MNQKQLLIVEAYPDEPSWLESGDLDLATLLRSKSVSEALQLSNANESNFLAIFSDFSCAEIRGTVPTKYVEAWIEGRLLSDAESSEAA